MPFDDFLFSNYLDAFEEDYELQLKLREELNEWLLEMESNNEEKA